MCDAGSGSSGSSSRRRLSELRPVDAPGQPTRREDAEVHLDALSLVILDLENGLKQAARRLLDLLVRPQAHLRQGNSRTRWLGAGPRAAAPGGSVVGGGRRREIATARLAPARPMATLQHARTLNLITPRPLQCSGTLAATPPYWQCRSTRAAALAPVDVAEVPPSQPKRRREFEETLERRGGPFGGLVGRRVAGEDARMRGDWQGVL